MKPEEFAGLDRAAQKALLRIQAAEQDSSLARVDYERAQARLRQEVYRALDTRDGRVAAKDIAKMLKISPSRVYQMKAQALADRAAWQ